MELTQTKRSINSSDNNRLEHSPISSSSTTILGESTAVVDSNTAHLKIHILRCNQCNFESVDKLKYDIHQPCVTKQPTMTYTLYKCENCQAISTSSLLMQEHKTLYHRNDEDEIHIKQYQDQLKPYLLPPSEEPRIALAASPISDATSNSPSGASAPSTNQLNKSLPDVIDFSTKSSLFNYSNINFHKSPINSNLIPNNIFNSSANNDINPHLNSLFNGHLAPILSSLFNSANSNFTKKLPFFNNFPAPSPNNTSASGITCCFCKIALTSNDDYIRHLSLFHNPHNSDLLSNSPNALFKSLPFMPPGPPPQLFKMLKSSTPIPPFNPLFHQAPSKTIMCPLCKTICLNFNQLDLHLNQVHSSSKPDNSSLLSRASHSSEFKFGLNPQTPRHFPSLISQQHHHHHNNSNVMLHNPMAFKNEELDSKHMRDGNSNSNNMAKNIQKTESNSIGKMEHLPVVASTASISNVNGSNKTTNPVVHCTATEDAFAHIKSNPQSQMIVHNTLRKTKSDLKVINRFLVQVKNEHRPVQDISPQDMDAHLQDFVMNAKKKDGHEYEPESLKAFIHSLERYLKTFHNYPVSVLKDQQFNGTRGMLHRRLQELRLKSKNNVTQSGSSSTIGSCSMVNSGGMKSRINQNINSIQDLIKYEVIGHDSPAALINTLWLINRVLFHIGGVHRHKNLIWGQFSITQVFGQTCLQFYPNRISGKDSNLNAGSSFKDREAPVSIGRGDSRLPFDAIEIFQIYANMRPIESRNFSDPFYLCPDPVWKKGGSWFKSINAGFQYISKIPRLMGFKSTSHSPFGISSGMGQQEYKDVKSMDYEHARIGVDDKDHQSIIDIESSGEINVDDDNDGEDDDDDVDDFDKDIPAHCSSKHSSPMSNEKLSVPAALSTNSCTSSALTAAFYSIFDPRNVFKQQQHNPSLIHKTINLPDTSPQFEAVDMTSKLTSNNTS